MVKYRRYYVPGATYFFTVTLQNRESCLLTQHAKQLGEAMREVKSMYPYKTIAIVIMPNHLHAMWELPAGDTNYSLRWRHIKQLFARKLRQQGVQVGRNRYRECTIWQKRFWEHVIRDEKDFENHANYIHYNPVKHRFVSRVKEWKYSSFHRYVKKGILSEDWSSWTGKDLYDD